MSIFLISGFCLPSLGIVFKHKQKNPNEQIKDNYEEGLSEEKPYRFLDKTEYPWGVCLPKGEHGFSRQQINWIGQAMQRWNNAYKDYVTKIIQRWGLEKHVDYDYGPTFVTIYGWPVLRSHKLFIWSCDWEKYNLIYPEIGPTDPNILAYHEPKDPWFSDFHGRIIMSNKEEWEKPHFINVMMHELGHVLGLPHLKSHRTDIMTWQGFGCAGGGKDEICELGDHDLKEFLRPYGRLYIINVEKVPYSKLPPDFFHRILE